MGSDDAVGIKTNVWRFLRTPLELEAAIRDAAQGVLDAVDSAADWLNENVADLNSLTGAKTEDPFFQLPEVDEPQTAVGRVIRPVAQYAVGFIPALRAVRMLAPVRATSKVGKVGQMFAQGAVALSTKYSPDL